MNTRSHTNGIHLLSFHNLQSLMKTPKQKKNNKRNFSTTGKFDQILHYHNGYQFRIQFEQSRCYFPFSKRNDSIFQSLLEIKEHKQYKRNQYIHPHGINMLLEQNDQESSLNQFLKQQNQLVKSPTVEYLLQPHQMKDLNGAFQKFHQSMFQHQLFHLQQEFEDKQISNTKQSKSGLHQSNTGQFDDLSGNNKPLNLIISQQNISQDKQGVDLFVGFNNLGQQALQQMPIKGCKRKSRTGQKNHLQKIQKSKKIKKDSQKPVRRPTKREVALNKPRGKRGDLPKNRKLKEQMKSCTQQIKRTHPRHFWNLNNEWPFKKSKLQNEQVIQYVLIIIHQIF